MMRRLEAIIACPKCDDRYYKVYAIADEKRPEFWVNQPPKVKIPRNCPVCLTILQRVEGGM